MTEGEHDVPAAATAGPATPAAVPAARRSRVRMTGAQRREQLLAISRTLFAEKGFDGTSIEEIAARADVSKPVVYEHFGGKEGIYAIVVDREMRNLLGRMTDALAAGGGARELLERAAMALLDYIEADSAGFRILVRDSPVGAGSGTFATLINEIATRVEHLLGREFDARGIDPALAPMYSQMLVGMVALTGQWWLDEDNPDREQVAAHLVNLAWNGLSGIDPTPQLVTRGSTASGRSVDQAWHAGRAPYGKG